jgi:hypothetical protein
VESNQETEGQAALRGRPEKRRTEMRARQETLGGSVDSGTCWSFKTLFVITAASARESRWVPF